LLDATTRDQQETLKMSRGLGKVQAGLLAIIERKQKPLNTYRLARMFYQPEVQGRCVLTMAQAKAAPIAPYVR
jgi:hypothetical protein